MARKVLGRGLDTLIPAGTPTAITGSGRLLELELDLIRPNPQQPRDCFDDAAIDAMAASLAAHGVLQPIVVREAEEGFEIIAGERRWRGAQRAGLSRIPAVVRDATPRESLELALIENLQREDLNAIEQARAYHLLVDEMGLTQEQIAARVGKERSTVANYLRLLSLPSTIQQQLVDGALSMGHARALLGLSSAAAQRRVAEEAVARGLSVRQTEARVRAENRPHTERPDVPARDPDVAAAEQRLANALGTPVAIRGRERGKVEITFTSLEELNRIYDLLTALE
ncbi:MAG TPA: ParB/RepB/Spo0J family partition protein [Acidobacteriota bacterium]|nr:ParB/RepB/Spo0J family partition protein [Acidobacteriota bacterium]